MLNLEMLQGCHGTPTSHCYTLTYIHRCLPWFVEQGKYSEDTKNALKAAWQPRSVGGLKV